MSKKRRKNKRAAKYIICVVATVAILLMIYLAVVMTRQTMNEMTAELTGPYEVIKVIDGDTIIASVDKEEIHIRLIGVDTPESVADETYKENTPEGEEAALYTQNLLEGNTIFLEFDNERIDDYGRTLCYVYLHDGTTMVNELLLRNGYARTMSIEPNTRYRERLLAAEMLAKENKAGFWSTGFFH